ncbi:MAG TPA: Hsp20/alpha crystallin family protein [Thermoanaerobaculia bacterium]|jgi:HSP20 family protein
MKEKVPVKYERPNPLVMFDDLRTEFEHFFDRPWGMFNWKFHPEKVGWAPKIDVFEKEGFLTVKADLPGMKKEDVFVTLEDDVLVLKGERKEEKEIKEENFYRAERMYGNFYRRLPLNFKADPAKIEAKFFDGVLEVRLPVPKLEEPQGLPIPIN